MQNAFMRGTRTILGLCALLVISALTGCGGGGGTAAATSTLITGTAAAGAPVVGYVSVRDSSTRAQPVLTNIPIAADGKYTVDVTGMTAPFAFLAEGTVGGKRVQLYSAATQADVGGTINITPFTDLIVRNVIATTVDTLMTSGSLANLTTTQINAQRDSLTAKLSTVMTNAGLAANIDLMRAAFNADGTGLDRVMDIIKVDTTIPTAITIKNILDAAAPPITVNPIAGTTTGTISANNITPAATTPIDLIRQTFTSLGGAFATALPSPAAPALAALFSNSFLDDGINASAFLTQLTTQPNIVGMNLANNSLVVNSVDLVNNLAQVSFVPVDATGKHLAQGQVGGALHWQMKLVAGKWLIDGNQRIAHVRVHATSGRGICLSASCATWTASTIGTPFKSATGLDLWIDNQAMLGIGSAVVTGPGLPAGGVTLLAQANQSWLTLPCNTAACINGSLYEMNDTQIGAVAANSTYTIALWSNAATPALLATYTEVVPVAPVLNTALAAQGFPSIGSAASLVGYAGGTLRPTWTMPAGLLGDQISVWLNQSPSGLSQNIWQDLFNKTGSGTATLVTTAPMVNGVASGTWTSGGYWIQGWDANGRKVFSAYSSY